MEPMTFESWKSDNCDKVETKYQALQDEYGDALTCFLSEYYEQCYREYLEEQPKEYPPTFSVLETRGSKVINLHEFSDKEAAIDLFNRLIVEHGGTVSEDLDGVFENESGYTVYFNENA